MMCNLPSNNLPCQGLQSGSPAPGPLTEEEFIEGMSKIHALIEAHFNRMFRLFAKPEEERSDS